MNKKLHKTGTTILLALAPACALGVVGGIIASSITPTQSTYEFTTCEWKEINELCVKLEKGEITQEEFCKSFTINGNEVTTMDQFIGVERTQKFNTVQHKIRVIDVNHDTISQTESIEELRGKTAVFTFEMVTLFSDANGAITSQWNPDGGKNYDYTNSIYRNKLTGKGQGQRVGTSVIANVEKDDADLYYSLKEIDKEVAVSTTSGSSYDLTTYQDKLFPLTFTEMAQSSEWAKVEGKPYKYWTDHDTNDYRIKKDAKDNACGYWLSSPYIDGINENDAFCVYQIGWPSGTLATNYLAVTFAFCI